MCMKVTPVVDVDAPSAASSDRLMLKYMCAVYMRVGAAWRRRVRTSVCGPCAPPVLLSSDVEQCVLMSDCCGGL